MWLSVGHFPIIGGHYTRRESRVEEVEVLIYRKGMWAMSMLETQKVGIKIKCRIWDLRTNVKTQEQQMKYKLEVVGDTSPHSLPYF